MKKLKGPELKMPELKVPDFLADLYYDLRDRRLLPLVALAVVAIAAVPFLLGGEVERPTLPPPGAAALGSPGEEKTSKLTVVEATPGLRDYRKRLRGRVATDPFVQQYTEPVGGSSSGEGSSASGSSSSISEESVTTESSSTAVEVETGGGSSGGSHGGSSSNGSGGSPPGSGQTEGVRLFEFVLDVQISHAEATADGNQKMGDPEVRHHVRSLTQLPGKKAPVVTSMSINLHTGKVVWLVSNDVQSLNGEFDCVARTPSGTCELLEIEPGFPLELVYGPNKVLYRIKVTNIDTVWAGKAGDQRSSRADFAVPSGTAPSMP
jgi:hypothetical protein